MTDDTEADKTRRDALYKRAQACLADLVKHNPGMHLILVVCDVANQRLQSTMVVSSLPAEYVKEAIFLTADVFEAGDDVLMGVVNASQVN